MYINVFKTSHTGNEGDTKKVSTQRESHIVSVLTAQSRPRPPLSGAPAGVPRPKATACLHLPDLIFHICPSLALVCSVCATWPYEKETQLVSARTDTSLHGPKAVSDTSS